MAHRAPDRRAPQPLVLLATLAATLGLLSPGRAGWHPLSRGASPTLTLGEPYRPGAYPVVLIHGMASDNRSWRPMIDRIRADRVLACRFQFWMFSYDSEVARLLRIHLAESGP